MKCFHWLVLIAISASTACSESESPSAAEKAVLPCEVQAIVKERCGACHGDVPQAGAPMSLVDLADFQAKNQAGKAYYELVQERIHNTDNPMPPRAQPQLTSSELATLDAFLAGGAQGTQEVCQPTTGPDAGSDIENVDLSECEMLVELRAHESQEEGATDPYVVPLEDDHYECFTFNVPWDDKVQLLRMDPIIDNKAVLHHWLLYEQSAASSAPAGNHASCVGLHPDGAVVGGWAPGGLPIEMPEGVGLKAARAPEQTYVLEIHYSNTTRNPDAKDRSGARLCATRKLRENEAATHQLGTEIIFLPPGPGRSTSNCAPRQTAHIIGASPHMHRLGRRMSTMITRKDGTVETLIDKPFDFNDQRSYRMEPGPVTVEPGDRLTTTCYFDNGTGSYVTFGSRTADEMCYNYLIAYPVGSLDTGGGLVPGGNRCMR